MRAHSSLQGQRPFFDRANEARMLQYMQGRPEKVTVVLGPQACGKTALIKHTLRSLPWDASRMVYLDTRYALAQVMCALFPESTKSPMLFINIPL